MNWFFKINQKSKIKNQKEKLFIGKIETSKLKLLGWDIMVKSKSKSQKSKVKEQRVKSKIQKEKDKRQNFETKINEEKRYSNILQNVRMFCVGKLKKGVDLLKEKRMNLLKEKEVNLLKRLKERKFGKLEENEKKEKKEIERIEFPVFFAVLGWQLRLALVRVRKKVLWPFKRYWQEATALILLISLIFSSIFWYHPQVALGATYYWVQTDWSGGATTTSAVHPTNRTNWTYYYEASTTLNIGAQISLATTTGSVTQTSDTDFSQGTRYQTLISGTGTSASIILDPETENNIQILNPKSEIGVGGIWEVKFTTKGNPKYPYLAINLKSQDEFGKDVSFEGLYCDDQLISPEKYLRGKKLDLCMELGMQRGREI